MIHVPLVFTRFCRCQISPSDQSAIRSNSILSMKHGGPMGRWAQHIPPHAQNWSKGQTTSSQCKMAFIQISQKVLWFIPSYRDCLSLFIPIFIPSHPITKLWCYPVARDSPMVLMSLNSFDLDGNIMAIYGILSSTSNMLLRQLYTWEIPGTLNIMMKKCRCEQKTHEQKKKQERQSNLQVQHFTMRNRFRRFRFTFFFWALFEDPKARHSAAHMQGLSPGMPWLRWAKATL